MPHSEGLGKKLLLWALKHCVPEPTQRELLLGHLLLREGKVGLAELSFRKVLSEAQDPGLRIQARLGLAKALSTRKALAEAVACLRQAREELNDHPDSDLLAALADQEAELYALQGKHFQAEQCLEEAFHELTRGEAKPGSRAIMAFKLGLLLQQRLGHRRALAWLEEAEQLFGKEEKGGVPAALTKLVQASSLVALGRAAEALLRAEQAEALLTKQAVGPDIRRAAVQVRALCLEALGRLAEAFALKESCLSPESQAEDFAELAVLAFSLGHPQKAKEYEERALSLLKETDTQARYSLFQLAMMRGEVSQAATLFRCVRDELVGPSIWLEHQVKVRRAEINLWIEQGELDQARQATESLQEELQKLEEEGADVEPFLLGLHELLGRLRSMEGDAESAIRHYRTCLELAQGLGSPLDVASAYANLGRLLTGEERGEEGLGMLREAERILRRCEARLSLGYLRLELAKSPAAGKGPEPAALQNICLENKALECKRLDFAGLTAVAWAQWQAKAYEDAVDTYLGALALASGSGMELMEMLTYGLLGLLEAERGRAELAEEWLSQAIERMQRKGWDLPLTHYLLERLQEVTGGWFGAST